MSDNSTQEKTEKATPQKIKKARDEGQIPRSKELTIAVIFLVVLMFFLNQMDTLWQGLNGVFIYNFHFTRDTLNNPWLAIERLGHSLGIIIDLLLPLFFAISVATILSSLILGGWLFNPASVLPKLSKLNPISGIKKIFSTRSLVELLKSTLKIIVIFGLLYWYLNGHLNKLLSMQNLPLKTSVFLIMEILFNCILYMGIALLLFGFLDIPFQQWEHSKQLKMSKQETKEEHKNNEGRPEIKQRIRQIQQQISRRKIEKTVPQADVIIINPTHYAVALKYDTSMSEAPFVVAKGIDETAMHIQRIAREHGVEVVSSPPLTRAIYHSTQIEQAIPSQLYVAVAHILSYVLQMKNFRKGNNNPPQPLPSFVIPKHLQH